MKTTIHFTQKNEALKQEQALTDARDYMGFQRFERIINMMREEQVTKFEFVTLFNLAGLKGYPVEIAWRYMQGELND